MGSGSRPGQGTGLLSWSANCSQSMRCAAVIGTSGTPSTTSAFATTVFGAFAVLAFVVLVGVDEDGEHAVSATPLISAVANQPRLTSSEYLSRWALGLRGGPPPPATKPYNPTADAAFSLNRLPSRMYPRSTDILLCPVV